MCVCVCGSGCGHETWLARAEWNVGCLRCQCLGAVGICSSTPTVCFESWIVDLHGTSGWVGTTDLQSPWQAASPRAPSLAVSHGLKEPWGLPCLPCVPQDPGIRTPCAASLLSHLHACVVCKEAVKPVAVCMLVPGEVWVKDVITRLAVVAGMCPMHRAEGKVAAGNPSMSVPGCCECWAPGHVPSVQKRDRWHCPGSLGLLLAR